MAPAAHPRQAAAGPTQYTQYDYQGFSSASHSYPGHHDAQFFHHTPQHSPTVAVPPDYGEAWQPLMPTINPAALNTPPTQLSSNMFDGITPPASLPLAVDNEHLHSTIAHPRAGLPRERSSRTAPYPSRRTTTKRGNGRRRVPHDKTVFIPHNTPKFWDEYYNAIWTIIFDQSLLPSDEEITLMANSAWALVTRQQTDASLIDWANAHNDEYRTTNFWPTILASITDVMKPIIEHSVYHRYNFDLDYTVMIDGVHIAERGKQIDDLVENDMFLYALLTVDGADVMVPFAHPAIIIPMIYLLRDSDAKYHRYIGENLNFKPLFAMTATLCRWALQERRTGRYVSRAFEADTKNRGHYMRYLSLFNTMPENQLSALTQIFVNCSAL